MGNFKVYTTFNKSFGQIAPSRYEKILNISYFFALILTFCCSCSTPNTGDEIIFCINLILLAAIKSVKFRFYTLFASRSYQYNDHTTFQFSADHHQSWKFLKYSAEWGSKVNHFRRALAPVLWNVSKSVSDIRIQ